MPVWHYIETGAAPVGAVPKLILAPTVAASGSEANNGAVLTNWETHEKCVLSSPFIFPALSIVDPELTLTLPAKSTAQGGVDIFCHLVEPYLTTARPSPLTDGILETLMRLARLDALEARSQLSWLSTVACSPFVLLGGGGGSMTLHGIEHSLSGYYDIAHGDGLSTLLPAWMRYTLPAARQRFDSLGQKVFDEPDGIIATEKWLKKVGMNLKLRALGVEPPRIKEMADGAVRTAPWLTSHPRRLDAASIARIYRDSY
jgi:hypothetical protein